MKVNIPLFLVSFQATCIDAWSTAIDRQAIGRGAVSGSNFHRMSTPNSILMTPKARGSPLWGTSFENRNDEEHALEQFQTIRSSQRRVKQLMDRGTLLREQIEESPFKVSFFWLSDQLISLTMHLRQRYHILREFAEVQANSYVSDQDWQMLQWLQEELHAAENQLNSYGSLVAEYLPPKVDSDVLQQELHELLWLSGQIEQAIAEVPDERKREMEEAYNRAQVSLGRLSELTQELAAIEAAMNDMEQEEPFLGYVKTGQQNMAKELEIATGNALPVTITNGTPTTSASSRARSYSTQLNSQLVPSADMFYEDNFQQGYMSIDDDQKGDSWNGFVNWRQGTPTAQAREWQPGNTYDSTLYDERSEKVAASAAAGSSRWGSMENEKVQKGSSIGGPPPSSPPTTRHRPSTHDSEKSLYQLRTEKVASASAAGKSRWGFMEVQLAKVLTGETVGEVQVETVYPPSSDTSLYDQRTEAVAAAAAAGKSRWGPMENQRATLMVGGGTASPGVQQQQQPVELNKPRPGTTEKKKVTKMAPSPSVSPPKSSKAPVLPGDTSLFDARVEQVVASAAAGKTRWGFMEVEKAENTAGLSQALDLIAKGLPKSSYVSPQSTSSQPSILSPRGTPSDYSLFDKRNEQVAAAAAVGQSRWGSMEIERARNAAGLKQALDVIGPPPEGVTKRQTSPPAPVPPSPSMMEPQSAAANAEPQVPAPSRPKGSTAASVDAMEALSREWAAMNRDVDSTPPKAAPVDPSPPVMESAVAVVSAPSQAKVTPDASLDPMAILAREWATMNQDVENKASRSSPTPTPVPVPVEPEASPVTDSNAPLKDLAQDWMTRAMAVQEPSGASFPANESPPPAPVASPPPPPPPRSPSSTTMDQLALQWAAMNKDVDSASSPSQVVQSPPPTPAVPPAPPRPMENDWDRLAKEWMRMNLEN